MCALTVWAAGALVSSWADGCCLEDWERRCRCPHLRETHTHTEQWVTFLHLFIYSSIHSPVGGQGGGGMQSWSPVGCLIPPSSEFLPLGCVQETSTGRRQRVQNVKRCIWLRPQEVNQLLLLNVGFKAQTSIPSADGVTQLKAQQLNLSRHRGPVWCNNWLYPHFLTTVCVSPQKWGKSILFFCLLHFSLFTHSSGI